MLAIIIFISILSVLVFIHELGHFLVARRHGVLVEEFGLGLPPRAIGRKIGRTIYSLNWLPIGGFVKLWGEDSTDPELIRDPKSFAAQSVWVRSQILLAGVMSNFLLGIVILTVLFRVGVPEFVAHPRIQEILPDSPAILAGVLVDDVILGVDDVEIKMTEDLAQEISKAGGEEVKLSLDRGGNLVELKVVPKDGRIGVVVTNFRLMTYPWREAVVRGLSSSVAVTSALLSGLKEFFVVLITSGSLAQDVAGPVGIAKMTGEVSQLGWRFVLQFAGILSINLGLINVLPFPALDGGRLLFVVIEGITGRRVNQKMEKWVHGVGMILLLLLLLAVTIQDIGRFFAS